MSNWSNNDAFFRNDDSNEHMDELMNPFETSGGAVSRFLLGPGLIMGIVASGMLYALFWLTGGPVL